MVSLTLLFYALPIQAQTYAINERKFLLPFSYKTVWNAAQIVLGIYPLTVNDIDKGVVKTSLLKKGSFWVAPFEKEHSDRYSQKLEFRFVKVHPQQTHLYIYKQAFMTTDFLGSKREIQSNGWEELRIFYKVKREIKIKNILSKLD